MSKLAWRGEWGVYCVYSVVYRVFGVDTEAAVTEIILGGFEQMVLLGILREDTQAFALEVRRWIERESGRQVSRGAFYTALERLREKGLVTWVASQPAGARRKGTQRLFSVTPEGLQALNHTRVNLQARCAQLERGLQRS